MALKSLFPVGTVVVVVANKDSGGPPLNAIGKVVLVRTIARGGIGVDFGIDFPTAHSLGGLLHGHTGWYFSDEGYYGDVIIVPTAPTMSPPWWEKEEAHV